MTVLVVLAAAVVVLLAAGLLWSEREVCDDPTCRRLTCRWGRR